MRTIVQKNCVKKVTPKKRKDAMLDIGKTAFIDPTPKIVMSLCRIKK